MGGELGVQAGTQTRKAVSVIDFYLKLLGELAVHGFNALAHLIDEAAYLRRNLLLLICPWQRHETNVTAFEQVCCQLCATKAFVANHGQVAPTFEQITDRITLIGIGTHQFKV